MCGQYGGKKGEIQTIGGKSKNGASYYQSKGNIYAAERAFM